MGTKKVNSPWTSLDLSSLQWNLCLPAWSFSRSTVSISALPPLTWACGPSPHLVASLCHPSTAPCRQRLHVDTADLWQSNLLLKALCCRILNQELKEDLSYSTKLQKIQRKKE